MLSNLVIASINHVLRRHDWACKRLQSFDGQTACIQIFPLINFKILINSLGELQTVENSSDADVTIILPSLLHPHLLTHELSFNEPTQIIGNQALADELVTLSKQLNISRIVEHDLSSVLGDIPAHRMTRAGKRLVQWHAKNFDALSQALAEYLTEENPLLAKPDAISQFIQEIQDLQHQAEAVEHRLDRLMVSVSALP